MQSCGVTACSLHDVTRCRAIDVDLATNSTDTVYLIKSSMSPGLVYKNVRRRVTGTLQHDVDVNTTKVPNAKNLVGSAMPLADLVCVVTRKLSQLAMRRVRNLTDEVSFH